MAHMTLARILGVDPGSVSASFALLAPFEPPTIGDIPTANRQVDPAAWTRLLLDLHPTIAIVERVSSRPRQGVGSAFAFGMGTGLIRGAIAALQIPIYEVSPTKWKAHFRLDTDKEKSRALAIRLYPAVTDLARKKDHGRAEALLMARYALDTLALQKLP